MVLVLPPVSYVPSVLTLAEPLYIDDLENILDEGMLSLNTMIEDGSVEEVCLLYIITLNCC